MRAPYGLEILPYGEMKGDNIVQGTFRRSFTNSLPEKK
jgi:hypothetical protein